MFSNNHFPVDGRCVLITGGSKGLGRSAGRQLAERGANVIIVARSPGPLQEAKEYIEQGASSPSEQRFHYISADLTSASECTRIISEATSFNKGAPPDIVWCCAGSSHPTLFIDTPVSELKNGVDSNYFSALYIAHATLRAWLRPPTAEDTKPRSSAAGMSPEPRHLIFTASFLALYSFAGYAAYSPTKAALRSLSDTLSHEMKLYEGAYPSRPRVRLHTLFPAAILNEAYEAENKIKSDLTKKLEEDDVGQSPDVCARVCIAGLERGDELVTTTWLTRLFVGPVLGGSLRNWPWMGLLDTFFAWLMSFVMVFVRWDFDGKARKWGRENGASGMKRSVQSAKLKDEERKE